MLSSDRTSFSSAYTTINEFGLSGTYLQKYVPSYNLWFAIEFENKQVSNTNFIQHSKKKLYTIVLLKYFSLLSIENCIYESSFTIHAQYPDLSYLLTKKPKNYLLLGLIRLRLSGNLHPLVFIFLSFKIIIINSV